MNDNVTVLAVNFLFYAKERLNCHSYCYAETQILTPKDIPLPLLQLLVLLQRLRVVLCRLPQVEERRVRLGHHEVRDPVVVLEEGAGQGGGGSLGVAQGRAEKLHGLLVVALKKRKELKLKSFYRE